VTESVTEQVYLVELVAKQSEVLRQIDEMTRKTELMIVNTMKFLGEQREQTFQRYRTIATEIEQAGLDFEPVSPVLEKLSSELQPCK